MYAGWCGIPYKQIIQFKISKTMSNSIRNTLNPSAQLSNLSFHYPFRHIPLRGSHDLIYPRYTHPPHGGYNRKIVVLATSANGSRSSTSGLEPSLRTNLRKQIVNFMSLDVEIYKEHKLYLIPSHALAQPVQKHLATSATSAIRHPSPPAVGNRLPDAFHQNTPGKPALRKPFHIFLVAPALLLVARHSI